MEILLVEDDPADAEAVVRLAAASRLNIDMSVARTGEEALAQLADRRNELEASGRPPPDLVLLDLSLPAKAGTDVLRWLKADRDLCEIPVVIVSGTSDARRIQQGRELGAHSHLEKPITLWTLRWIVTSVHNYRSRLGRLPATKREA